MATTDPIAEFLTTLRNAIAVHKDAITIPHSKVREAIAKLLHQEGYINDVKVLSSAAGQSSMLQVELKYAPNGAAIIQGIRRISRPGQRIYSSTGRLHKVLGGVGMSVVSTSAGLMTDQDARDQGIGGEVLFKIW